MFFVTCAQPFKSFDSSSGSLLFPSSFNLALGEFAMCNGCFAGNTFGGPVYVALALVPDLAVLVSPLLLEPPAQSLLLWFLALVSPA